MALVARGEFFVEDDGIGHRLFGEVFEFGSFARADKGVGVGPVDFLIRLADDFHSGSIGQQSKLGE